MMERSGFAAEPKNIKKIFFFNKPPPLAVVIDLRSDKGGLKL